jgi:hypothetical protein
MRPSGNKDGIADLWGTGNDRNQTETPLVSIQPAIPVAGDGVSRDSDEPLR